MSEFSSAVVFTLVYGGSYGIVLFVVSIGLVLMMGLMRLVNLAHGVFAAAGGYIAIAAMQRLGLPYWVAICLAAAMAAGIGAVLEPIIYRRLYRASELDQVLMTIGVVFVGVATFNLLFGPDPQPTRLPGSLEGSLELGTVRIPTYRAFVLLVGGSVTAALWFLFDKTAFGARLRAAVENRSMAAIVGIDVPKLLRLAFVLGCGLAGVGGALGIPILPIEPTYPFRYLTLILVVVTLAGIGNVKAALAAALFVGISDTAVRYAAPSLGSFALYAILIAAVLWRARGSVAVRTPRLPGVTSAALLDRPATPWVACILFGAACIVPFVFPSDLAFGISVLITALFVMSLDFVLGFAGVVTLGHALFFGFGSYAAGLAAVNGIHDPLAGLAIGGLVGCALAALSGPVILRLTGLSLIMATLSLAVVGYEAANKATSLTGGDNGLTDIEISPVLGLFRWSVYGTTGYVYSLAVLALSYLALRRIVTSSFGVALQGIRENRQRMLFLGCPVVVRLVQAYAISGFFAGAAGALWAQTAKFVGLEVLAVATSVDALVMLTLGGIGVLVGALAGTPIYMIIHHAAAQWNPYHWMFVVGGLLMAVVRFAPGGVLARLRPMHRPGATLVSTRDRR